MHGIVNGTTNFILTEMARTGCAFAEALAEAQRLGYAEADPSEDVDGRDAAAKMAIIARLAFETPVHIDQVRYEGIEHIQPDDLEYARELGLGLKLIGTAERIGADGLSVSVYPGVPVPGPSAGLGQRAVQRGHGGVGGDHRDHHVRPGRRRPADRQRGARRRDQRDDPAGLDPAGHPVAGDRVTTSSRPSTCTWRWPTSRACWRRWPRCWPQQDVSVKSVVQKGMRDQARLVMVVHPVLESRFAAAMELIAALAIMRAPPRAIRVIEEEFGAVWPR